LLDNSGRSRIDGSEQVILARHFNPPNLSDKWSRKHGSYQITTAKRKRKPIGATLPRQVRWLRALQCSAAAVAIVPRDVV
jgi:hypothetical protein